MAQDGVTRTRREGEFTTRERRAATVVEGARGSGEEGGREEALLDPIVGAEIL